MARLSIGMKCIKGTLFLLNLSFFIAGALMIGLAAYAYHNGSLYGVVVVPQLSVAIIVLGSIVTCISFFGCCGASQENRCLLGLYFTFVLLILLTQFAIGIAVVRFTAEIPALVEESWNTSDPQSRKNMERAFQCCGLHEFNATDCGANVTTSITCYDKLMNFIHDSLKTLAIMAFLFASLEIIGILFTCCLFSAITEKRAEHKRLLNSASIISQQYNP